jgi:hypothetical protein
MATHTPELAFSVTVQSYNTTCISRGRGGDRDGGRQVSGWQGGGQTVAGRRVEWWQVAGWPGTTTGRVAVPPWRGIVRALYGTSAIFSIFQGILEIITPNLKDNFTQCTTARQHDSPTARQHDSPTARQPDSPTARQPDSPTARHPGTLHSHHPQSKSPAPDHHPLRSLAVSHI